MTPVIVLGNRDAGDDAAGPLVADALRAAGRTVLETADVGELAESLALVGRAIVVDAAAGPGPVGSVHRLESDQRLIRPSTGSSHGLGLVHAVALARALGGDPILTVFAIVGRDFRAGADPAPEVVGAARRVAEEIIGCA